MPAVPPTLAALLLAASTASATITIDTVLVGDAGNGPDPIKQGESYGAVDYNYHIGTYEVTNRQYTAFLNAVAKTDTYSLYDLSMDSTKGGITRTGTQGSYSYSTIGPTSFKTDMADKPVNYVSFWDAARFANWLTNGQPTGSQDNSTTETGMYNLGGETNPTNGSVTRQRNFNLGQNGVAITSEDEWFKAAYYDGLFYNEYPTGDPPTAESPPGGAESANYADVVGELTEVGAYTSSGSHYGTFDQGGNVFEWNDTIINASNRGLRGGSYDFGGTFLRTLSREDLDPTNESDHIGFRVTSLAPIPEPSSYGAIFGIVGLATAVFFRRRRRRE